MRKICIFLLTSLLTFTSVQAQQSISTKIDLVNQNIWRGVYQAGASIQPEVVISYRNFEFSAWGTTGLEVTGKEIDLTAKYYLQNFSFGITDYWCDAATASYRKGHIPEVNLEYAFSKIPLSLSFNTVVYGDNKQYSSYAECLFSPSWREWEMEFAVGLTPWGNELLKSEHFTFTRLSVGMSKIVPITATLSIKPFISLLYNPNADTAFWITGISLPF